MGNCVRVHRRKEKQKFIKADDSEIRDRSLTVQQGIYNSLNQQEIGNLIQNNASVETGESSKLELEPLPTKYFPICIEPKYLYETSAVEGCLHVFCLDCIRGHIEAKIQDNAAMIRCPEFKCESVLEIKLRSLVLPPKVLERRGNILYESAIQAKNKLYCPFEDCLALLLADCADIGIDVTESKCPHCFRLFCARCKVPWHSDLRCEDYQEKLERRFKDDEAC